MGAMRLFFSFIIRVHDSKLCLLDMDLDVYLELIKSSLLEQTLEMIIVTSVQFNKSRNLKLRLKTFIILEISRVRTVIILDYYDGISKTRCSIHKKIYDTRYLHLKFTISMYPIVMR